MISNRMDINNVLAEMRSLKSQVQVAPNANEIEGIGKPQLKPGEAQGSNGFGQILEQAVTSVNDLQNSASTMASDYEKGVPGISITDVMVESQKSSVSFEAMVQVRNKLVDAYRDIMNMPL